MYEGFLLVHFDAGMSRVPVPTHLLEKASMPGRYKVSAFVNVTLGAATGLLKTNSTKRAKPAAQRILDKLRGSETETSESAGAFHFFGNTASSGKVDLGPIADEALARAKSSRTGEPGTSGVGIGCADAIYQGANKDNIVAGRPTTLCKIEVGEACQLCLHSSQPLQNLNLVAELVVEGIWRHGCLRSRVSLLAVTCVCSRMMCAV